MRLSRFCTVFLPATCILLQCAGTLLAQEYIYTPAQIRSAYGFNGISFNGVAATGAGETIAIVDAYNNTTIQSDLVSFDSKYGISAPPSFTIENQNGGSQLPTATNSSWGLETDIDVEWAHAIAPKANILLVETNDNAYTDLNAGVTTATKNSNTCAVSMSWGSTEYSGETSNDAYYQTPAQHQGISFVASTGDNGAVEHPSASPTVLAVGGTSLYANNGIYGSETAWNDSYGSGGSGISTFETEPSYQLGVQQTGFRSVPDVSYDADGNTSFSAIVGGQNYYVYGTSCGAPQWAALIALADQGRALGGLNTLDSSNLTTGLLPSLYALADTSYYSQAFNDVTTGTTSTGQAAGVGYDTATGLGTPKAGFLVPYLAGEVSIPEPSTATLMLVILGLGFANARRCVRNLPQRATSAGSSGVMQRLTNHDHFCGLAVIARCSPAVRNHVNDDIPRIGFCACHDVTL